ncbi:hypothetical protein, partial [Fischerella muscicola]|uniref:hypothetical protein n=1 Tax=Fischerella muscicola TaxID=92938 RepID=UPI0012F9454B
MVQYVKLQHASNLEGGEVGRWGDGELTGPHDRQGGASAVDGFPGIKHLALGIRGNGEMGRWGRRGSPL